MNKQKETKKETQSDFAHFSAVKNNIMNLSTCFDPKLIR
jgi:hypothetical protein